MDSCSIRAGCDRMTTQMTLTFHPSLPLVVYSCTDSGLGHMICLASEANLSQGACQSACIYLCSSCFSAITTGRYSALPANRLGPAHMGENNVIPAKATLDQPFYSLLTSCPQIPGQAQLVLAEPAHISKVV